MQKVKQTHGGLYGANVSIARLGRGHAQQRPSTTMGVEEALNKEMWHPLGEMAQHILFLQGRVSSLTDSLISELRIMSGDTAKHNNLAKAMRRAIELLIQLEATIRR